MAAISQILVFRVKLYLLFFFRDGIANLLDVLPKSVSLLAGLLGAHADNFKVALILLLDCAAFSALSMAAASSFAAGLAESITRIFRKCRFAEARFAGNCLNQLAHWRTHCLWHNLWIFYLWFWSSKEVFSEAWLAWKRWLAFRVVSRFRCQLISSFQIRLRCRSLLRQWLSRFIIVNILIPRAFVLHAWLNSSILFKWGLYSIGSCMAVEPVSGRSTVRGRPATAFGPPWLTLLYISFTIDYFSFNAMLIRRQLITSVDSMCHHPAEQLRIILIIRIEIWVQLLSSQIIIKLLLMTAQLGQLLMGNQLELFGYVILQVAWNLLFPLQSVSWLVGNFTILDSWCNDLVLVAICLHSLFLGILCNLHWIRSDHLNWLKLPFNEFRLELVLISWCSSLMEIVLRILYLLMTSWTWLTWLMPSWGTALLEIHILNSYNWINEI